MFELIDSAYAMGAPPGEGEGGTPFASLLPFVLMFAVLYFHDLHAAIEIYMKFGGIARWTDQKVFIYKLIELLANSI